MSEGYLLTLLGRVDKVFPPIGRDESGKAQIIITGAEVLYREIRVPNVFRDADGDKIALEPDAEVEITIKVRAARREEKG